MKGKEDSEAKPLPPIDPEHQARYMNRIAQQDVKDATLPFEEKRASWQEGAPKEPPFDSSIEPPRNGYDYVRQIPLERPDRKTLELVKKEPWDLCEIPQDWDLFPHECAEFNAGVRAWISGTYDIKQLFFERTDFKRGYWYGVKFQLETNYKLTV